MRRKFFEYWKSKFSGTTIFKSSIVNENYVVCTLIFLWYYIYSDVIQICKDKTECGIYKKKLKNEKKSSDILSPYW